MKNRIVWKTNSQGSRYIRVLGPMFWGGGTVSISGKIYIYDELPGEIEIKEGFVFWRGQNFCSCSEVQFIFDSEWKKIFPGQE